MVKKKQTCQQFYVNSMLLTTIFFICQNSIKNYDLTIHFYNELTTLIKPINQILIK